MVEKTEANLCEIGEEPGQSLADAWYYRESNLEGVVEPGAPDSSIAVKKNRDVLTQQESTPRGRPPKGLTPRQRRDRKLRTNAGKAL